VGLDIYVGNICNIFHVDRFGEMKSAKYVKTSIFVSLRMPWLLHESVLPTSATYNTWHLSKNKLHCTYAQEMISLNRNKPYPLLTSVLSW